MLPVQAMRTGNIRQLNASLETNQWRFIRAGTYLVLEKLKQPVLRRLLKRTALLHAQAAPDKASQLPLRAPLLALVLDGVVCGSLGRKRWVSCTERGGFQCGVDWEVMLQNSCLFRRPLATRSEDEVPLKEQQPARRAV